MAMSPAELKRVKVQSIRDIAAGLEARAASMKGIKEGLPHLPHVGTWTGVSADAADHEVGTFGTGLGAGADTEQAAAKKVRNAADEFEGLQQLLSKLENEAHGAFAINADTGEVTPLSKDFNKSERDYIAATLKQLGQAGEQANVELATAIHATDSSTTPAGTNPAGAPPATAPQDQLGIAARLKGLTPPNPDGDPGATKAAAAPGDTHVNYKELYPKTTVPGSDKPIDPRQLGSLGTLGVRDGRDQIPQPLQRPVLRPDQVEQFKADARQGFQKMGVPADRIEQKVNAAVEQAQTPHFKPDVPALGDGNASLSKSPGDRFIDFTNDMHEGFYDSADATVREGKTLVGQAGPGAPGVAEAWGNLAKGTGEGMVKYGMFPVLGLAEDAQHAYQDPGHFAGQKLFEATAAAPTLPLGGEGAALTRGLEGAAIERGVVSDLSHGLDDGLTTGHHTPPQVDHPAPSGDHTPASVGDHSIPPAGNHAPYAALPHDAPVPSPLPSDHPLFNGYHDTPPGPNYTNPDGSLRYPDASDPAKPYAVPGTVIDNVQLQKGTVLGRFGYPGGEWLAPEGTPFAKLSLPNESALKPYYEYVVNDPTKLPPGWRIEESQVAPWFNQPGMGPQYRVIAPPGKIPNVEFLEISGFLGRIGRQ
ncbi:DUF4237 domain-containing protein [Mycobacterium sp. CBMA271]|uniref:TNT domain-containing protein n=1 Tax=unclassified Mycobacteroides TaxID=2618759 RepID=UPI0012DC89B2|nr:MULTISPECIES: TNT domain-containing protein [unclassified Mycobacteroides]MUM15946.1 hypothetical protein [Mycobacteroides sp. CBMA 326]MUM24556.1 DUF4237 domain-containing protein [Mycobacteroides sp. CBMA 271]